MKVMRKHFSSTLVVAATAILFAAAASAQQSPAQGSTQAPTSTSKPAASAAPKSSTAGQSTGAAKTGQAGATVKKPAAAAGATLLKTDKDRRSYAIGLNIGAKVANELKSGGVDMDSAILARGIRDSLTGGKHLMTDEEVKTALTALETELREKARVEYETMASANKKEGDDFLATNKSKEGVQTLPSGLQYKVLKAGTGPKPAATDSVSCNYKGTFLNGKEFDSSEKHGGKPVTFGVSEVIRGWTEALLLMPVGSKWQLFVPSDLAYGPRGAGQEIGPNTALIFEVELVSITPKTEEAKPDAAKPDRKPETKPETSKPEAKPESKPNSN
jgi:FKBP-type peptidyl-prolyl cis-trans isomerase FklB